jgi:ABC-type nitrate/sulfonate/bicarbonate transport system substrate-binding protein
VTTEHLLKARPETVGKFVRALLEAWRQALDPANEKKAVETIHQFDKNTPLHIIRRQLAATRVLVKPSPETEIGAIDVKAWAETERIMVTQKLIPRLVGVERILRSGSGTASPKSCVDEGS